MRRDTSRSRANRTPPPGSRPGAPFNPVQGDSDQARPSGAERRGKEYRMRSVEEIQAELKRLETDNGHKRNAALRENHAALTWALMEEGSD